jgi:short-subunit dehydrogenase involved in D-alanine esterification of teichoic acids
MCGLCTTFLPLCSASVSICTMASSPAQCAPDALAHDAEVRELVHEIARHAVDVLEAATPATQTTEVRGNTCIDIRREIWRFCAKSTYC